MRSQGLQITEFGKPQEVLKFTEFEVDSPSGGEVLVKMLAAPINPSDLGTIGGSYGVLPELPGIGGLEGVAEVLEVGDEVTKFRAGDIVKLPPKGTWATHLLCLEKDLEVVPDSLNVEQAAMAAINPLTAVLLLEKLQRKGDWFVQNAANSAVGIALIQLARAQNITCVNLVRREDLILPLKELGAEHVLLDNDESVAHIKELSANYGKPSHAFNSVGGESAYRMAKSLRNGGQHITFGGMTGEQVRFPTRYLIFNDIQFSGFWVTRWKKEVAPETFDHYQQGIYKHIKDETLQLPVEQTYQLSDFQDALAHNARPRLGKILFVT
jgi:trans-2-enoyl-CoA reductase